MAICVRDIVRKGYKRAVGYISMVVFALAVYVILHEFFARNINAFTESILAAALGAIMIIACTAIMLRFQSRHETMREYSHELFGKKMEVYEEILKLLFAADDDNILTKEEIQEIENAIGLGCLFASDRLVGIFVQFVYQLKIYGVMYYRSMRGLQIQHFEEFVARERERDREDSVLTDEMADLPDDCPVMRYFVSLDDLIQGMRADLAVVEGDISKKIEKCVMVAYDEANLIADPNVIDPK